jgi:hypothetical protein
VLLHLDAQRPADALRRPLFLRSHVFQPTRAPHRSFGRPYDQPALNETAPALWLVVATGVVTGLLSSIVGYVLLGLPYVKVRVRHELHIDDNGARVESYVRVANVRGRQSRSMRCSS